MDKLMVILSVYVVLNFVGCYCAPATNDNEKRNGLGGLPDVGGLTSGLAKTVGGVVGDVVNGVVPGVVGTVGGLTENLVPSLLGTVSNLLNSLLGSGLLQLDVLGNPVLTVGDVTGATTNVKKIIKENFGKIITLNKKPSST